MLIPAIPECRKCKKPMKWFSSQYECYFVSGAEADPK